MELFMQMIQDLPDWSFIKCRNILEHGTDIHQVKLIENFMLDEIKDYFTRNNV